MASGKYKVLMVTLRADYGGGPEHVYKLVKYLGDKVEAYIACPKEEPYWKKYAELVGEERMYELPHRKFSLGRLFGLVSFISRNEIEIIHSHGKGAGLYSRLAGWFGWPQVVHTYHGVHYLHYTKIRKYIYLRYEEFMSWFTARCIAVSGSEYDLVLRLGIVRERLLRMVNYGIEQPENWMVKAPEYEPKLIISVTRFDVQKFSERTVEVVEILRKLLPDEVKFELLFIGTGPGQEALRQLVEDKKLGDIIRFGGAQPNMSAWYARGWCYLSTSRWEGLSIATLEAMAHGLPIVASKVVGNRDAVTHNVNGYLFDLEHPEVAAQYLCSLLTEYPDYAAKSRAARETARQKHDIQGMADRTYHVYQELLITQ